MKTQSGQGLVQALVGIAISGIMLAVFSSMMQVQNQETRALSEKLGSLDLERSISTAIRNGTFCKALFAAGNIQNGALTINPAAVSATAPHIINLKTVGGLAALDQPVGVLSR